MSIPGVQIIDDVPCITTVGLNNLLPFVMQGKEIMQWGFTPKKRIRSGMWWACSDVPKILDEVSRRMAEVREQFNEPR